MNDIALVTANFGAIDAVRPLPARPGVDAFYYIDDEGLASARPEALATWTRVVVPDYPRHDFSDRLRGRYFKHQIYRLDEVRDHRWLAWADSSLLFHDMAFLVTQAERLAALPPRRRVLVVPHPDRRTVREEYDFIMAEIAKGNDYLTLRYATERLPEQLQHFARRGWSADVPLYCGTFWMVENSEICRRALDDWWDQNLRYGLMDQLSLTPILDDHDLTPQLLNVALWNNIHFQYVVHQKRQ